MARSLILIGLGFFFAVGTRVHADLVGPLPYLSTADIPANLYLGGSPIELENFEDGILSANILASAGMPIDPNFNTDSVDADDGLIDGFGTMGHSFFSGNGRTGITFTFPTGTTAAGLVWTDGFGLVTFEAFGPNGLLGTISAADFPDLNALGGTGEDRFFGAFDAGGITQLHIFNSEGGIEVDHIQYGVSAVPEPSTLALVSLGAIGFLGLRRRKMQPVIRVLAS